MMASDGPRKMYNVPGSRCHFNLGWGVAGWESNSNVTRLER
jgi:hypothetical protein